MNAQEPGAYMILNVISNARYVGGTVGAISKRWCGHRNSLNRNRHSCKALQKAWNECGPDAFIFAVLENTTREIVLDAERKWHTLFKEAGYPLYNARPIAFVAQDWPPLVSPDGMVYHVHNLHQFCVEHELSTSAVRHVLLGHRGDHKGWRLLRDGELPIPFTGKLRIVGVPHTFVSPDGVRYCNVTNVDAFAREHGLTPGALRLVAQGQYRSHKGWTAFRDGFTPKTTTNRIPARSRSFLAPDGTLHEVNGLGSFCRQHGLDKGAMLRVGAGKQHSHLGWTLPPE